MNLILRAAFACLLLIGLSPDISAQELKADRQYPVFGIGVTGIRATFEPGMIATVQELVPGSPAAEVLQPGDILLSVGGRSLAVEDPRIPLGAAIGEAEGRTGRLVFEIRRGERTLRQTIRVPLLGAYSQTWPLDCTKSETIIRQTASYIVGTQRADGSYMFEDRPERDGLKGCLAGLFLLSTNDRSYLSNVRRHVHALAASVEERPTTSTWHLGYQGILLAEYYLKTGDRAVLPGLKSLCDRAAATQAAGGWGHGGLPNPGYVQSGLMNSAGVPVLTALILARECGVAVDEESLLAALRLFYRMVGHGNVCYGDHRAELWWPNTNGRNAMLACALSLLDEPRYQQAARHLALLVADSYYKPEFGHTGGGFNVIWRGIGSVHVPKNRQAHYRRQMDRLAWYYDLCRQPDGGFSMPPTPPAENRYTGRAWATGAIGLTYTAPRRTLRITGAPRTRYSVTSEPLNFNWGTNADLVFLETEDAAGFGAEIADPHEVYELLIGKRKSDAAVDFCAQHLRHFSPMVRSWAARRLNEMNNDDATRVLKQAVRHTDPRVRRAVFDAVSGYDNWSRPMRTRMERETVSSDFLPAIRATLKNPKSAWWEIDGALFALGRARPEDVRRHIGLIETFSSHEEWYLREAAFWSLEGLREFLTPEEFEQLAEFYARESRVYARNSFDPGFRDAVRNARVPLDSESLGAIAGYLGPTLHSPLVTEGYEPAAAHHEAVHRTMMILKHFDADVHTYLIDDYVAYLDTWEPYYQHSVWLISGSKWQPGILAILPGLGSTGMPLRDSLERIVEAWDAFDQQRIERGAREELRQQIREAVDAWEG